MGIWQVNKFIKYIYIFPKDKLPSMPLVMIYHNLNCSCPYSSYNRPMKDSVAVGKLRVSDNLTLEIEPG